MTKPRKQKSLGQIAYEQHARLFGCCPKEWNTLAASTARDLWITIARAVECEVLKRLAVKYAAVGSIWRQELKAKKR